MKMKLFLIGTLLFLAVSLFAVSLSLFYQQKNTISTDLPVSEKPVTNPLKGFVAWGENYRQDPWISFAYIPVCWSLLEPEEGVYDFEELESRCFFSDWKADGVRLILRVIADTPSEETHMDIPQWLYEKMGHTGNWYDTSYGKGFSPDYRNAVFQEAHTRLIQALADRYSQDPQVAFLQLGSLGHWGEWHVNASEGIERFPFQTVTDGYVQDYLKGFPSSMLLLRRPYDIGAREHLGLYNDSFGQPSSHEAWLSWISDGYTSDQNGEALSGMPDFWKYAPSGGEFATDRELSWYFSEEQYPTTLDLLLRSHTTFLGPNAPKYQEFHGQSNTVTAGIEHLLSEMGYCLGIRQCRITNLWSPKDLEVTLTWENTGIAPLYQDWEIYLEIQNASGKSVWSGTFDSSFSDWGPGTHSWTRTLEGTGALEAGEYTLFAGVVDPLMGTPGVRLRMEGEGFLYAAGTFPIPSRSFL